MRWWLSLGPLSVVVGSALVGCTGSEDYATGRTTTIETSIAGQADPTSAACAHFETMWIEQAQIQRPAGMPSGGLQDPHGEAAIEASRRAFDAAAKGSAAARRLGAEAETRFTTGSPAAFNETVAKFFQEVCGTNPPEVECEPDTLCEEQHMDGYG